MPKTRPTDSCCWRISATTPSRACSTPAATKASLYARATDVLVTLHHAGEQALLPGLGAYAGEALIDAAMLLPDWYLPEATGRPTSDDETAAYRAAWRACLANLPAMPDTLLLRDYHQDNLMWLPARPGVKACGLLDFQDAQQGHPSYDLVSLIEDARRDVSPAVRAACLARYIAETGLDEKDFGTGFALMAAQRHARIIGLFIRLLQARRQTRLPAASAACLADVRALPAARGPGARCAPGSTACCRRRCGGSVPHDRYRHDPGGRPRRAHAAAHRHHAQAADSRRRPLAAGTQHGSTDRLRRHAISW